MNRTERRKQDKADHAQVEKMWPGGFVEVPEGNGIKDGDVFTIAGYRRMKNGIITKNCKPGTETRWVAKIV